MKKLVRDIMAISLASIMLAGCGSTTTSTSGGQTTDSATAETTAEATSSNTTSTESTLTTNNNGDITIGVSIWGTNDSLGGSVKSLLDSEAEALGINLVYVETSLKSEEVVSSIENLAAAGCDGIIVCNSADTEMAKAIATCEKNQVYLAQYFRQITDESVLQMAQQSKYYLGCVHEDEEANGYKLCKILVEDKGDRNIGMINYRVGDATSMARIKGYQQYVQEWNEKNPDDQVTLGDVVDDKFTAEEARQAAESMIDANPDMDGLVVVGGSTCLEGVINGIESKGLTGKLDVVSTDFPTNLGELLQDGKISAMSGGHYADPYFALMMVYNAVRGNFTKPENGILEIKFPFMYVSSPEDYEKYDKYFVQSLPYDEEEDKQIAEESFDELAQTAANLSIEDVESRHTNQ